MLIKTKIEYLNEIILLISDEQELFDLIQSELKISDTELDDVLSSTVTDIIEND
jgi:hypothetical protein